LLAVLLIFWACKGPKEMIESEKEELPEAASGNVEYAIETYDAKFKTWYDLQKSQDTKQSQKYYENWNKKYVKEWNHLASIKDKSDFYVPIVGYKRTKDLGFEINHQLFYIFNMLKMC
jgi:hypothetical protein